MIGELRDRLPEELVWNVLKYTRHPIAEMVAFIINLNQIRPHNFSPLCLSKHHNRKCYYCGSFKLWVKEHKSFNCCMYCGEGETCVRVSEYVWFPVHRATRCLKPYLEPCENDDDEKFYKRTLQRIEDDKQYLYGDEEM